MGTDERDRVKRSDEPDVEAHRVKARDDEPQEPEDKADDKASEDTPDVEAHVNKA